MKTLRSKKRKPTHPGEILREDVFPALEMTQIAIAKAMGVSRRSISQILHEHKPVTPDMAIRLARFLGSSSETWLNLQHALDVWLLEQDEIKSKEYQRILPISSQPVLKILTQHRSHFL
jgi:addiction module HigA family antidote